MNVWQSAATLVYDDGSLRWTEFVREPKRKKKHIDKVLKKMGRWTKWSIYVYVQNAEKKYVAHDGHECIETSDNRKSGHKFWMCSCGMYWIWSETDARRHEKEENHKLTEMEMNDEEFERIKKEYHILWMFKVPLQVSRTHHTDGARISRTNTHDTEDAEPVSKMRRRNTTTTRTLTQLSLSQ